LPELWRSSNADYGLDPDIVGPEPLFEGEFADQFREANRFWLEDYQRVFREGVGGKMARFNKYGDITPDEKIVKSVVMDSKKGLEQFNKLFSDNPESNQLLRNGLYDLYAKDVVRDGVIKPALSKTFLRNNKTIIDKLPDVKDTLLNAEKAQQILLQRSALVKNKQAVFAKSRLAKLAKLDNIDEAINTALSDERSMMALKHEAYKTKEGRKAFRRSIAEGIRDKKDPYQYIADNEKLVIKALGKEHADHLKVIAEGGDILARRTPPSTVKYSRTVKEPVEEKTGTSFRSILSQLRMAAQGRVSQEYVAADITGKFLFKVQQKHAEQLIDAAIYDKTIAKTLAGMSHVESLDTKTANSIKNHLFSLGVRVSSGEE
jgi:hypothetical protein